MLKRTWNNVGLIAVVLSLLVTVSCAKKVVQSEPAVLEEMTTADDLTTTDDTSSASKEQNDSDLNQVQSVGQAVKEDNVNEDAMAAMQLFVNEDIYFDYESSALGDQAKDVLNLKAKWMRMNPDASVIIEGHCDERGTNAYNIALGDRRAESVKSYLVDLGIDAAQITKISYGEERPADPGTGEAAWAKNRRAHFVVERQ